MVGVVAAWAVLLAVAGAGKLVRPGPGAAAMKAARIPGFTLLGATPAIRLTGLLEVGVGVSVIVWGARWPRPC